MAEDTNIFSERSKIQTYISDEVSPSQEMSEKSLSGFKLAVQARRSIRVFDGKRIHESEMQDILDDAILAPSSSNLQPYELYWIKDAEKKSAVAKACLGQPAAKTAGELVVVVARGDLWKKNRDKLVHIMTDGGKKELPAPVNHYYTKLIPKVMSSDPFGIFNLARRFGFFLAGLKGPIVRTPVNRGDHRIWAHTQAALTAQTLMLSFSAHGYDSCPMGGMDAKRIKKILQLPRGAEVSMVISAGTRKPEGLYGPRYRLLKSDLVYVV